MREKWPGWSSWIIVNNFSSSDVIYQNVSDYVKYYGDNSGLQEQPPTLPLITILNNSVSAVETFRFLGSTISQDLKWAPNIDSIVKKAQQRMYFLHQLKKFNLPLELLIQLYTAIVQSVLCTPIIVWFGSTTKQDRNRLKRKIRTAERIIGVNLPSIQDLYTSRVRKRAGNISADPSHPGHNLFELLPSRRRYRTLYTKTSRYKNSFFPQAVTLMNTWSVTQCQ